MPTSRYPEYTTGQPSGRIPPGPIQPHEVEEVIIHDTLAELAGE